MPDQPDARDGLDHPDLQLHDPLPGDPIPLLRGWLDAVAERALQPNPHAMTIATTSPDGQPEARLVICRGFDADSGHLVFYTNRNSPKGRSLAANPRAAAVFHWDVIAHQIRIEGPITHSPDAESDAYFARRPRGAAIAAWASDQSAPVSSRAALDARFDEHARRFGGVDAAEPVPRPPHWGGYRLWMETVELWVGREARFHDRARWRRALERVHGTDDGYKGGAWSVERLQP